MRTLCCGYEPAASVPCPVMWNEFNQVVQCHACGSIYVPKDKACEDLQGHLDVANVTIAELREALAHYKNSPPPHPACR